VIPRREPSTETVCGHVLPKLKLILTVVVIITFVYFGGLKPVCGIIEQISAIGHNLSPGMEIGEGDGFVPWFERDLSYVTHIVLENDGKLNWLSRLKVAMRLRGEVRFLEQEIRRLQDNPSYTHPTLGFHVYDRDATGWLHVLYKAADVRGSLLASHLDPSAVDDVNMNELPDGTPLYEPAPGRLPKAEEVAEKLEGMALPPEVFHDYRVYILPSSLGEISGLGSKGYMLLGAPPVNCTVMEHQMAFTVAHELGHHIHMTFLGASYEENPKGWDEYMSIRGIPVWTADGDVNSGDWFESTEETFAEDIRVLFGTRQAASWPHGTVYKDPRLDPALAKRLQVFVDTLAEAKVCTSGQLSSRLAGLSSLPFRSRITESNNVKKARKNEKAKSEVLDRPSTP
jgi:hypothetical protein